MSHTQILSILLTAGSLLARAAASPAEFTFSIDVAALGLPPDSLTQSVILQLDQSLRSQGGKQTNTPDWIFCVGTKGTERDGETILSVTLLRVLPDEVIAIGREREAFYLKMPAERRAALPEEGKWVREMVSEEALRQFGKPLEQKIILTTRERLNADVARLVEEFSTVIRRGK